MSIITCKGNIFSKGKESNETILIFAYLHILIFDQSNFGMKFHKSKYFHLVFHLIKCQNHQSPIFLILLSK